MPVPGVFAAGRSTGALAEEIVVTARRQAQPAHEVGSAISVFTRDDIITRGVRFVPELLRE
ncbi:MAG: hypothetical protein R3E84_23830, partial [Pseudomonadales bacterium]